VKLSDDFYQACVAMRNQPGPQRFIASLEDLQKQVAQELVQVEETDDILRLQGQGRLLSLILDGYNSADDIKRRLDVRAGSGAKGPSKPTTT